MQNQLWYIFERNTFSTFIYLCSHSTNFTRQNEVEELSFINTNNN